MSEPNILLTAAVRLKVAETEGPVPLHAGQLSGSGKDSPISLTTASSSTEGVRVLGPPALQLCGEWECVQQVLNLSPVVLRPRAGIRHFFLIFSSLAFHLWLPYEGLWGWEATVRR
jgi:hypothetical protein